MSDGKDTIVSVVIQDYIKRREPKKHYTYQIEIKRASGDCYLIFRRFREFFDFNEKLSSVFFREAGRVDYRERILPYMPQKIIMGRSAVHAVAQKRQRDLEEYLRALLVLPPKLARSDVVYGFLTQSKNDIVVKNNLFKKQSTMAAIAEKRPASQSRLSSTSSALPPPARRHTTTTTITAAPGGTVPGSTAAAPAAAPSRPAPARAGSARASLPATTSTTTARQPPPRPAPPPSRPPPPRSTRPLVHSMPPSPSTPLASADQDDDDDNDDAFSSSESDFSEDEFDEQGRYVGPSSTTANSPYTLTVRHQGDSQTIGLPTPAAFNALRQLPLLRLTVASLLKLPPSACLTLSYVDDDLDLVAIVAQDDLDLYFEDHVAQDDRCLAFEVTSDVPS